jgi:hypothetical protein
MTGKGRRLGAGYEVGAINRRIMDKLGYLSVCTLSNKTPDMPGRHPAEQLLDEIHHGDGRVAVRGDPSPMTTLRMVKQARSPSYAPG